LAVCGGQHKHPNEEWYQTTIAGAIGLLIRIASACRHKLCGRETVGVGELGWSEFVPANQPPLDVSRGIAEQAQQRRIAVGDMPVDIADVYANCGVFNQVPEALL
jgi:hypothetical protein